MGRWPVRQTIIVNCKTSETFRGVLWKKSGPLLVLRGVQRLSGTQSIPVDGEVVIERANVSFLQILPEAV